jgi:hypothetical protein
MLLVPLGLLRRKRGKGFNNGFFRAAYLRLFPAGFSLDLNASEGISSASIRTAIYGRARVLKGGLYFTPTASWRNGKVGHSRDFCNHPSGPSTNLSTTWSFMFDSIERQKLYSSALKPPMPDFERAGCKLL